ncbi:hypothetical protein O0L34_g12689 [Tuta absoluta]|nr:hypothetical protein O0L34_g12689 [Tuta absoluta]
MVSIVLLTTEEILSRNGFWYCLDNMWITEDMDPFEEVKPEHVYAKPLSRDHYYAQYPEIPRSESEDENSISIRGFLYKHREWKSKISIRKFDESRRHSVGSLNPANSNPALNVSRRVTSLVENAKKVSASKEELCNISNDERIRAFFNRLIESVPPPLLEGSHENKETNCSIITPQIIMTPEEMNDIALPDYDDFEKGKMLQNDHGSSLVPGTSTIRRKKNSTFNSNSLKSNFEDCATWNETIYGISDVVDGCHQSCVTESSNLSDSFYGVTQSDISENVPSWSEIVDDCGLDDILKRAESVDAMEEIVSQSHCADEIVLDFTQDNDDEIEYARFAIYKIYQTLKLNNGMIDSSSMKDFDGENIESNYASKNAKSDLSFRGSFYHLAPRDESPPENELQKNSDRVLSEHELRVQRSLQKLNVPEWYKNAPAPREGFLLRKRLSDASSSATRWSGLNSKTTSLGSLGGVQQPPPPQLSPHTTSFGRWSTSRLNSNQTSPCSSTRSSIRGTSPLCSPSTRSSFSARQPYLGWRSQERLNSTPRTPHERLASSLLQQQQASSRASEEIQTSIKEVTSAIVHYVSGLEPANGDLDRSASPRSSQKLYWLESSFVGTKPLDSPQTPLIVSEALPPPHPRPPSSLRLDHRAAPDWQDSQRSLSLGVTRPSPGSTTLEDVLDSLLGLPSQPTRIPTPQPSPRKGSPYYMVGGKSPRYEQLASSGHSSASPASRFVSTPSEGPSSFTDPSPDHDRPGRTDMQGYS